MGKREQMVKLAEKLMYDRENIRNIGIVAHIDHGKCVSKDTQIYFSSGRLENAENVFKKAEKAGKKVKENKNEVIFDVKNQDFKVISFNKNKKEIEEKRITHAWKLKANEPLVKLTLSNGLNIKTTSEHKYLTVNEEGKIVEKEASKLKEKEFILSPKKVEIGALNPEKKENQAIVIKKELVKEKEVYDFTIEDNHNFIGNGCVIHNTTLTDNLIACAGLISQELAGQQCFMDSYHLEQERGITINAANISIVYKPSETEHLINIIDTPGHVDFGGDVIRAMRAVDGVILVVDSVEGVMPQTETVIKQALREKVKPVLFINKVDRIITELQLTQEQMQERFVKTIAKVNTLIEKNAPKEFKDEWKVNVANGSVAFGSGVKNWGLSAKTMKASNIGFKEVYDYCKEDRQKELAEKSPVHKAVLDMALEHLPNPLNAQKYRIPTIWGGELESEEGKDMLNCNEKGIVTMMVTDITVDSHAGDVATGRVYSGTLKKGVKLNLITLQKEAQIQQVAIFMGPERVPVDEVPAGNIASIIGLKEVFAGETISSKEIQTFETFKSSAEPVMTISVEAKSTKDLPKLIEVIKQITKEDPNIRASINQETGEHLLSGMGELHLEITQYRIDHDHKIPIQVSPPIVVYHEAIQKKSQTLEGKSPNKHNKFKIYVEPIPAEIFEKLVEAKIDAHIRPKDKHLMAKLVECGFSNDDAKSTWAVHNNCVLINSTRGIQALTEIKELVIQGFEDAVNQGPLAMEKASGVTVVLEDAKLHEDSIHRGPAQVLPAITRTIYACMLMSNPVLLEPKQTLSITVPQDYLGAVSKELGSRRTQINEMRTEGEESIITAKAPVKELIGFSQSIRSATQGRAIWTAEYSGYEQLPRELQNQVVREIRKRKGVGEEPKKPEDFLD
ncbi:MAG: elongation factor EF-2 [archaeon]